MRWTRKTIIVEIKRLHEAGEELYYSKAEHDHLNLVRAAGWHFGTWRRAVEEAGVDYESLSRYQRWSKKKIVERIRELHAQGLSLHWRAISTEIDPPLAAAALRKNGFNSWREAIAAAGMDIESVARYKEWDNEKVLKAVRARKRAGLSMFSKSMQKQDQSLFCAARRRFGSWDGALNAAGLNADSIRLRKYTPALNESRHKSAEESQGKITPKIVTAKSAASKSASTPATRGAANNGKVRLAAKAPAKLPVKTSARVMPQSATKNAKSAAQKTPVKAPSKTSVKTSIKAAR